MATVNSADVISDENQEVLLGMRFDYAQKSVRLAQKTVDKLPRLETLQRQMPLEEVERLMGRLFFAAEILAIDLKHAYYAIKFYRAMCRRLTKGEHPHTIVTWWSAAWEQLRWWLSMALTNEVRYIEAVTQSDTTATIFTDASTTGFGIVIINGGHVLEYGASWYHSKFWRERGYLPHITHLELWAVGTAVRLARACGIQSAHLFVDNMAALAALKNRRSTSYWMNSILTNHVWKLFDGSDADYLKEENWENFFVTKQYVISKQNWADFASRVCNEDMLEYVRTYGM